VPGGTITHGAGEAAEGGGSPVQGSLVLGGECVERPDDLVEPALRGGVHQCLALIRGRDHRHSRIVRMRIALGEAKPDETVDDPGHRGPGDILGLGEATERRRTTENEHRERAEASRRQATLPVDRAETPQEMDCARIEVARGSDGITGVCTLFISHDP